MDAAGIVVGRISPVVFVGRQDRAELLSSQSYAYVFMPEAVVEYVSM